jgi:hypothetical protein
MDLVVDGRHLLLLAGPVVERIVAAGPSLSVAARPVHV